MKKILIFVWSNIIHLFSIKGVMRSRTDCVNLK